MLFIILLLEEAGFDSAQPDKLDFAQSDKVGSVRQYLLSIVFINYGLTTTSTSLITLLSPYIFTFDATKVTL